MNDQIQAYFNDVPVNRRERLVSLHDLILKLYPDADVDMSYRMPTYRHAQGWVAIANQKRYVSLYTCSYEHIEAFKQRYPEIKTGKGCINFRDRNELPLRDIKQVIHQAMQQVKIDR